MLWFPISILAYFLNASAITIDKFLLTKKIPNPAVYAFFIATLSLLGVILIPFGFEFYSCNQIIVAIISGLFFTYGILYMFKAISGNEASRVTPFMGGLQPIFIAILAFWFLNGSAFNLEAIIAFLVLVSGTFIISYQKGKIGRKAFWFATVSTFLLAVSYTIAKYSFDQQGFVSGFVWTRVGSFLGALTLLFVAQNRKDILKEFKKEKKDKKEEQSKTGALFLAGQSAGALSFVLVNYAMDLSPNIAIVHALRGTEYVFLMIIIGLLSFKFPKLLEEKFTPRILVQKTIAIILIIIGLILLRNYAI